MLTILNTDKHQEIVGNEDLSVCTASIEACSIIIHWDGTYCCYIGINRPSRGNVQNFVNAITQLSITLGHPRGKKVLF